jgi:hypothetical protein
MEWDKLKSLVYEEDGSLRDFVIYNFSENYWKIFIEYINITYKIEWAYMYEDLKTTKIKNKIDFNEINYIWNNPDCNRWSPAEFYINNIPIKVHFFENDILECSFWPDFIKNYDDHVFIIEFLKSISKLLNKEIYLYPELPVHDIKDWYFLKINKNYIEYKI